MMQNVFAFNFSGYKEKGDKTNATTQLKYFRGSFIRSSAMYYKHRVTQLKILGG